MPDLVAAGVLAYLLKAYSPIVLAFSGGLDSRFLAFACKRLGVDVRLYLFQGPHTRASESLWGRDWAARQGLECRVLPINPLTLPEVQKNEKQRCYYCKRALFGALRQSVAENPPFPGQTTTICDGSNATDSLHFRPGALALRELSIHSPLLEANLGKPDIRRLAALWHMDNPLQIARPCLLTRFDYGLEPTAKVLRAVGRAEDSVERLLAESSLGKVPDFRLRLQAGKGQGPDAPLADYAVSLHVQGVDLPEHLEAKLAEAVMAQGFSKPEFVSAKSVSGYFDADAKPHA
jgi:uncharacterized protein